MPDNTKKIQNANPRSTEGSRVGVEQPASQTVRGASANAPRKRGRPKGSTNKPKGLVPSELASAMLIEMKDMLPPEHFEYMKGVVREGKSISTKSELSILILLLSRNLYPALVMEAKGESEPAPASDFFEDDEDAPKPKKDNSLKMPSFRKDVTERLKVLQGLITTYDRIERGDKDANTKQDTILTITAQRGFDRGRLLALVGVEPSVVAGNADTIDGEANGARDVSDQAIERQVLLPSGEQGEADWRFDSDRSGGTAQGSDDSAVHSELHQREREGSEG